MKKSYFYIIQRDGFINEIEFTPERFSSSFEQWKNGGILVFPTLGFGINCVDISKILNEEQYKNYISSVKPKEYIKNGTWRDSKENQVIRHEKWRQLEIEAEKKQSLPDTTATYLVDSKRENKVTSAKDLFVKYRPQFMKDLDAKETVE